MADIAHQSLYEVFEHQKTELLLHLLTTRPELTSVAIFLRTRDGVHALNTELRNAGIMVDSVHPTKKESQRELALRDFKNGKLRVIITTDAYARSVQVEGANHIVNYQQAELYQDYAGRAEQIITSDAEHKQLITFATPQDRDKLAQLEKHLGTSLPRVTAEGFSYDSKDETVKNRKNAANPNRTKSRGIQSKPLQNKKQKLRKNGK